MRELNSRAQGSHFRRVLAATLLLLASSCFIRTSIRYSPRALDTSAEAMHVIYEILEGQHGQFAPIELEVTEEKLSILRTRSNPLLGTSGVHRTVIRYSTIGEVSLSRKNRWSAVTLAAENGIPLLHVYTSDAESGERFMDAIETMRRLAVAP